MKATRQAVIRYFSLNKLDMRFSGILLLMATLMIAGSCKKDKEGSLTLHFLAQAEGNPLEMFKTLSSTGAHPLQFSHVSMLISDIQLLTTSGSEYLKDVALVDMSFDDLTSASDGFTIRIDKVPANTYRGISFGIGVPPELNNDSPSDFPSSNPLSRTGYYWEAWNSYIFMKIEGRVDTIAPLDFETGFAYHTGHDSLYRMLEGEFPLAIIDGQDTELSIIFDYDEILEGVDIALDPQNHNPEDTIQIFKIVNNLQTAVTLFQ